MSNGYTNLQPTKLKAVNYILNKSIDIDLYRILLADNDITVTISTDGLQTTNLNGLTMDCSLNMNQNNVRNINSLEFFNGINIYDNYNNSIIGTVNNLTLSSDNALLLTTTNGFGHHINIKSGADIVLETLLGGINLESQNDMNFTSNGGGLVSTMDYIELIATNQYINLEAFNNITLTSLNGDINLDASNNINITTPIVNNGLSEYIWDDNLGNKNQISAGIINISDSNNNRCIIGVPQYGMNVINSTDPSTTPITLGTGIKAEGLQMSNDFGLNNEPNSQLLLSPEINVMVLKEVISNNNPTFKIMGSSNYSTISSTLLEFSNGINIQDLNGSSITSAGGDITLQTGGAGVLSLNSGDNIQLSCGENFFVSTNTTAGIIQFNSPTPTYFNLTTPNTADGVISVAEINRNNGIVSIISQSDSVSIWGSTGVDLNVTNGALNLTSAGAGIGLTTDQDINLDANTNINISNATGFTNSISLNTTTGDTTIASAFGSVNITSGNGDAGASSISLFAVEGDIGLNTGGGYQVSSNAPITSSVGYTGKVYHTDQPTTALTYYLTFVQSGGVSGYYDPAFDSATLTYNPSTNLLAVAGLQLSGATINGTFATGVLTLGCNESSSRQFQFGMTANITGLTLSNRRTNGVYTCSIYNVSGSTWSIDHILTGAASNKTDYNTAINIANGEFAVLTARTLFANGTAYNFVSVVKFL
jgi:uncharacterized protein (DUF2345 family)